MSKDNILKFPFDEALDRNSDTKKSPSNNVTIFSAFYKEIINSKLEQNSNVDNLENLANSFYEDISSIWRKVSFWDFVKKFPSFDVFPKEIKNDIAIKIIRNGWFHILRLLTELYNFNYLSLPIDDFVIWLKHQFICNWKSLEGFEDYIQSLKNRQFWVSYIFEEWSNLDMNNVFNWYRKFAISKKIDDIISNNSKNYSNVKLSWIISSMDEVEKTLNKIKFVLNNSSNSGTYVLKFQNIYGHYYEIMYTPNNSWLTPNNFFDICIWDMDDFYNKTLSKFNDFKTQLHTGVCFWFVLFKK